MEKNKTLLKFIIILFCINILCFCKKYSYTHEAESTVLKTNQILYEEIKNLHIKDNYKTNPIKSLDIKFQNYNFKIRYIEDRAYIQYSIGNKIITDWEVFNINFYYDSSYEFAEKDIRLLYNSTFSEGILLLPSFTEEFPSYFLYKFNSKKIQYLKDIELSTDISNLQISDGYYQALQQKDKIMVSFFGKNNTEYKYSDRDYTPVIDKTYTKDDIRLLNGYKNNDIIGLWKLDCSLQNSGIEIFRKKDGLAGTLALAPPAIFINVILEKSEKKNIYYLKYESQDINSPLASENEINEDNISKKENIGEIIKNDGELEFTWYGVYDNKTKKRVNLSHQFNDYTKEIRTVKLKKCKE